MTGDKPEHHVLDRPRNNPTRTAFGVAGMTCYAMLWIGGGNDLVATQFHVSLNAVTYFLRVAVFVAPVIAFMITKRICIGLQRADRERVLHGSATGVIVRSPDGGYDEAHVPISTEEAFALTQHPQLPALAGAPTEDDHGKRTKTKGIGRTRARLSRWYLEGTVAKPTAADIEAAAGHESHDVEPSAATERQELTRS